MIAVSPWGMSLLLILQAACWFAACRAPDNHVRGAWQLAAGWLLVTTIGVLLDP